MNMRHMRLSASGADVDQPGFTDPIGDSQVTFRALLGAMAVPGSLHQAGIGLHPPTPLAPATAAVLLTMVDAESPLALDQPAEPARAWIAFHCGAAFTTMPRARFAVALRCPDLMTMNTGSDEGPEESCTLFLQVCGLGTGTGYRLRGPGLPAPATLRVDGLPEDFAARWAANHALFPRGIDIVLCAGTTLAALPRSVTLENV